MHPDKIDLRVFLHDYFQLLDILVRREVLLLRYWSRVTMEDKWHLQLLASPQQLRSALALQRLYSGDIQATAFMLQTHHAKASPKINTIRFLQRLDVAYAICVIQIQSADHGKDDWRKR